MGDARAALARAAALEAGFRTSATVYDYQVESYSKRLRRWWRPKNAGGVLRGPVPIFEAFARSLNNATIRLLDDVGVERIAGFARRAGITSPLAEDRSLALGTSEVTPLEITAAYATFARGGARRTPRLVRRVLDRDGQLLLEDPTSAPATPAEGEGISPVDAYLVTHLLRGVVRRSYGTGHAAAALDAPLVGKTGSTNRNRDAWFVAYSPQVAAGVWVGHDDMSELGRSETGSHAALPIWMEFMATAVAKRPDEDGFDVPDGLEFAWTDSATRTAQRSKRFVAWAEPVAVGRKARTSTYVAPPKRPAPAFAEAPPTTRTLGSFQTLGAPTPLAPLVE